ncbi:MAG: hypothetical protein AB7V26_15465 [Lysobacterales bacterium]
MWTAMLVFREQITNALELCQECLCNCAACMLGIVDSSVAKLALSFTIAATGSAEHRLGMHWRSNFRKTDRSANAAATPSARPQVRCRAGARRAHIPRAPGRVAPAAHRAAAGTFAETIAGLAPPSVPDLMAAFAITASFGVNAARQPLPRLCVVVAVAATHEENRRMHSGSASPHLILGSGNLGNQAHPRHCRFGRQRAPVVVVRGR